MFELLAPAGDFERLKIAFMYGADAVYVGGQNYSLRANAKNFSNEELNEATIYTHKLNKKIYVTVNIVFHQEDLIGLEDYLRYLEKIKVDGIIASDIAVIKIVRNLNLNLFIVLSTQASVYNEYSALFWKNLGVERIVLARETSKKDIKRIIDNTGVETEVFIHGAMCTSFSGKCILSNVTTNRDANRGGCAQVCRWCFENDDKPTFTMMSKDLNMINHIEEMMNMGVVSYKVEGRMRSIYYVATIIGTYRKIFDLIKEKKLTDSLKKYYLDILNRCANRESKDQFFEDETTKDDQYFSDRMEVTNKDFLGIVKSYDKNNKVLTIEQRNYFKLGDIVEFFGPNKEVVTYKINNLYDEHMNEIEVANHAQMTVKIKIDQEFEEYTMIRLKVFDVNNY